MLPCIPYIRKEDIDELEYLTPEERQLLWDIVSTSFQKLSTTEQKEVRVIDKIYFDSRHITAISELLLKFQHVC